MLAKELKIKTVVKQRCFIESQLNKAVENADGDLTYSYTGYIFPEVRKYFEDEGYVITTIPSEEIKQGKCYPVNVFTPSDSISLTEDELKQSERIYDEVKAEEIDLDSMMDDLNNLFK